MFSNNKCRKHCILDCDGGSDDAWALLLLLRAEQFNYVKLLAVTVNGCGNTTCENAARNMSRILKACSREDIPIYLGAVEPLVGFIDSGKKFFHGRDGFGDCLVQNNISMNISDIVQPLHAVAAIRNLCETHQQQITILAVGPLTNLALGYTMYGKQFVHSIKDIFIMGGNYQGVGNSSRCAEFNFYSDPEAAHAVLLKSRCPITILPWEPCTKERFYISISWRLNRFVQCPDAINQQAIEILTQVENAQWLPLQKCGFDNWNPCDALLVASWLFDLRFIKKSSNWNATVDLTGKHTRGQMVLDHLREREKFPENVRIIELVDDEFFKQVIEWTAGVYDIKDFTFSMS